MSLGWIGQVWVYVNGAFVTSGKNFYYPENDRRPPDGRLSLQNGSFNISLRKGDNDVAIALYSTVHEDAKIRTKYGWGLVMHVDDTRGIILNH